MKVWSWVVSAAALAAVGGVAGFGVAAHEQLSALEHAPAYAMPEPAPMLAPATGAPVDRALLIDALSNASTNPALADFHAHITDATTGDVIFTQLADVPLRPASTTKVLTAAAALYELGAADTLTTTAYRVGDDVYVKASGDVWMDADALDELAAAIPGAQAVYVDTSIWDGMPEMMPGWNEADIDGGFVAPLQPAMLNGGRGLEEATGDVPRSHTPALDVAQALADRVGAAHVDFAAVPEGAEQVAEVSSPDLITRLDVMMKNSDNVYAEAIAREVRLATGSDPLTVVANHGFDTTGCVVEDGSGLSTLNLITPALLDAILADAATNPTLRPLLTTLPVAAGDGTLIHRYGDLPGRGWVRAKTGTLDDTSGLAGTVTSVGGNVYTFAFLSNGSNILDARRAMDEMASILREY
ncbi:D-alanyl-D-alanine carboxypeptidase/D-alanyl-D-alanine-endopeptidase [Corynebacterium sp. Q4381]|uniref:D-alanyl-D-alanine carboxypeptidase/D-alanyl-D-alanine endopeptidase n=1 Tax=Corynebacterium sp. Marseille-Q4381 TaxID=3121597 RepID=UPI002FE5C5F6